MPTIARIAGHRFFFYSNEGTEPPHVHVRRDRCLAKFWLDPVVLANCTGYAAHDLTRVERLVRSNRVRFLRAWNEFFAG